MNKRVDIGLTYIFGIGRTSAIKILAAAGVPVEIKVKDLTEAQANKLREEVEKKYRVEGELKREVLSNIKRLKEIGCYRGMRHSRNLPVRGILRRTMGSGKRKLEKT